MGTVNAPPTDRAKSIFDDLGYSVSGDGHEFSAVRDWKEVLVTAVAGDLDAPENGTLRCFVAWEDEAARLVDRLEGQNPNYEWAVIGVSDDGSYRVDYAPTDL